MNSCFALVFVAAFFSVGAFSLTLEEAFAAAKDTSESLKSSKLDVEIAGLEVRKAQADFLPTLSLQANSSYQDPPFESGGKEISNYESSYLSLSQSLFQGGADYYGAEALKASKQASKSRVKVARNDLLYQVAQVYLSIHGLKQQLALLVDQQRGVQRRVNTLKNWESIGRAKKTDLLSSQSQLERLKGEVANTEAELSDLAKTFKVLTELDIGQSFQDPSDPEKLSLNLNPQDINRAPSFQEQDHLISYYKKSISSEKGSYFPEVNITGNYYLNNEAIFNSDTTWEATLGFSWEFYQGGNDTSQVRIQRLNLEKQQLKKQELTKSLRARIAALNERFQKNKQSFLSHLRSSQFAKASYRAQQKDFQNGLVSAIELTRTLDELIAAQQARIQAKTRLFLNWYEAKALIGNEL